MARANNKTNHPMYVLWTQIRRSSAKTGQPLHPTWANSIEEFTKDVGEKPDSEYFVVLGRLDYLKPWEPGNVAWFTRSRYGYHVKKENHRLLMKELGQPIPPHVPPAVSFLKSRNIDQNGDSVSLKIEQSDYRSSGRKSGERYAYRGHMYTLSQLSVLTGIPRVTLKNRLKNHQMTVDEALTALR